MEEGGSGSSESIVHNGSNIPLYIAIVLVISMIISTIYIVNAKDKEIKEYKKEIETMSAKSISDSIYFKKTIHEKDSMYQVQLKELKTESEKSSENLSVSKTVTRIIYKDSIKEIYSENTESNREYTREITMLRDSLSALAVREYSAETVYVEKLRIDTVSVYKESESKNETKITAKKKSWNIYAEANGFINTDIEFSYDVEIGGKVFLTNNLYGKMGLGFNSKPRANLGIGIEF